MKLSVPFYAAFPTLGHPDGVHCVETSLKMILAYFEPDTKNSNNGGLELADIAAYIAYRSIIGDPSKKLKVDDQRVNELLGAIKTSARKGAPVKLIHNVLV
jgi:hypothetical protein